MDTASPRKSPRSLMTLLWSFFISSYQMNFMFGWSFLFHPPCNGNHTFICISIFLFLPARETIFSYFQFLFIHTANLQVGEEVSEHELSPLEEVGVLLKQVALLELVEVLAEVTVVVVWYAGVHRIATDIDNWNVKQSSCTFCLHVDQERPINWAVRHLSPPGWCN